MKYKSCRYIQNGIFFKDLGNQKYCITHCCNMDGQCAIEDQLFLVKDFDGRNINWDNFFKIKTQLKEEHKKEIYHPVCAKCWELVEKDWNDENYINDITCSHWTKCNSRCSYCDIGKNDTLHSAPQQFSLIPLIEEMEEKQIIKYHLYGSLRFVGGEPTIAEDFEELLYHFIQKGTKDMVLPTSGIKFSPALEYACKEVEYCHVLISIDAGCRDTYKKIKGVDAYKNVIKNIKKYAKAAKNKSLLISKFIIVKDINDNKKEIDKWLKESKKIGLTNVGIDVDYNIVYKEQQAEYKKHILDLLTYCKYQAEKMGLKLKEDLPFYQHALKEYTNT